MASWFADTSFWIGLSSRRDQYHQRALEWHQLVLRKRTPIVTTEAVLIEWLNALSDVSIRRIAAESYLRVRADLRIEVVPIQHELMRSAVELYHGRPDKRWSLTDCISFVVMGQRAMTEALTTDRDFEQAGMKALMLSPPPA